MKKKFVGAILTAVLTMTMVTPAFAEIIWTPDKLPEGYTTNEWENKDFSFYSGTAIKRDTYTCYIKDLHGNFMKNVTFAGGKTTNSDGVVVLANGRVVTYGSEANLYEFINSNVEPYEPLSWFQDSTRSINDNGVSNYWYGNSRGCHSTSNWEWLMVAPDGTEDGLKYTYCFNEYGYLYTNTITPDGYMVNELGQLTIDGNVKTINPREIISNYNNYPIGYLIYDPQTRAEREATPNPYF